MVADTALTPRCTSSTSAPENFLAKMSSTKLSSSVHGPLHICFSVLFCGSTYSACLRICLISAVRRILLLFPGAGSSGSYLLLRDRHLKYHLRVYALTEVSVQAVAMANSIAVRHEVVRRPLTSQKNKFCTNPKMSNFTNFVQILRFYT